LLKKSRLQHSVAYYQKKIPAVSTAVVNKPLS
jgi:hypothetical protein